MFKHYFQKCRYAKMLHIFVLIFVHSLILDNYAKMYPEIQLFNYNYILSIFSVYTYTYPYASGYAN